MVCDEAHRTTGVTLAGEDESAFVRVHDQGFLRAKKRLYMTATPRLYDDASKAKAAENTAVLASMDDEALYGPELHRLGFGEAVEQGLLSDYKVLVLAVDESAVSKRFQTAAGRREPRAEAGRRRQARRLLERLAKRGLDQGRLHANPVPMRRAVAFAENIKISQKVARLFEVVSDQLEADSDDEQPLRVRGRARGRHLQRARTQPAPGLAQGRPSRGLQRLPGPVQRPLPLRRRGRTRARRGAVPQPAQLRGRCGAVGRAG